MKTIKLTILFLFIPFTFFAQSLTGLWIGSVSNDSTTSRKDQSFEIVLTQYKDKVYGYSRSTFIVNDTLFYIVKRVKGTIEGDLCEVKDDDIVSYNFPGRLDKGVKRVSTFRFDQQDSIWRMDGEWKTNKTKKYYAVSGKIELNQEKDLSKSKIFPHLEELKLADDIAFYKESKKASEPVAATKPPIKENKKDDIAKVSTKPDLVTETKQKTEQPVKEEKIITASAKEIKREDIVKTKTEPALETIQKTNDAKTKLPVKEEKSTVVSIKETKTEVTVAPSKQEPQKSEPVVTTKLAEQKKEVATMQANTEIKKTEIISSSVTPKEKVVTSAPELKPIISTAAAQIAERKIAPPQVVNFKSDSLELALYDNGEVDGDTVSVLLNGEVILAKQGLKTSAIKKMIYAPAGGNDSLTLVLYAENLGKYPPNTGLLIVHDGDDSYQIRFSADLQQNAAVIFKRKR